MEILNRVHARNLVQWAKDKPEAVVLSADLTNSTESDLFKESYPERFFSLGIAEQNMVSFAGGMAREGFRPLIHTFAVFIYRRAYDQIAMSIAYPNLPVIMFGFLPGIISPGGATHQAIEDISIMRSLPNMTVLECGDATEVENVLDLAWRVKGPVYIRMLRGEIPRLFPQSEPMQLDRVRILKHGTDLAIFSSGICTEIAMQAVAELSNRGVSVEHCHISTLKPFTDPAILDSISRVKYGVVTMENHTIVGGLGTCIAEVMAENGFGKKLIKIGLKDTFVHGASRSHLMQVYGLNQGALFRAAGSLLGRELEHRADEYQEKDLKFQDKLSRAEDL